VESTNTSMNKRSKSWVIGTPWYNDPIRCGNCLHAAYISNKKNTSEGKQWVKCLLIDTWRPVTSYCRKFNLDPERLMSK
jgi:hypothetical protein